MRRLHEMATDRCPDCGREGRLCDVEIERLRIALDYFAGLVRQGFVALRVWETAIQVLSEAGYTDLPDLNRPRKSNLLGSSEPT